MAVVPVQRAVPGGTAVAFSAAAAGDEFEPGIGRGIYAKNTSAAAIDVTIPTPAEVNGVAVADIKVSVPNGGERLIAAPPNLVRKANGKADLQYSALAGLSVAVIEIP